MCGTRRTTTGTSSFPHTSACVWLPSTTAKSCSLWGRSERPSFGLTFHLGGCPWEVTVDSEREFGRYVRLIIGELIYLKPYCKFFSHVSERRFSYYRSQLERVAHLRGSASTTSISKSFLGGGAIGNSAFYFKGTVSC